MRTVRTGFTVDYDDIYREPSTLPRIQIAVNGEVVGYIIPVIDGVVETLSGPAIRPSPPHWVCFTAALGSDDDNRPSFRSE